MEKYDLVTFKNDSNFLRIGIVLNEKRSLNKYIARIMWQNGMIFSHDYKDLIKVKNE